MHTEFDKDTITDELRDINIYCSFTGNLHVFTKK